MRASTSRAGFTLIEVLMAVVILAILTLGLMANSGKMIRGVTDDRARTLAATAADERIARIRVWPNYATLDTFVAVENNTPLPGWTRTTTIVRTGGVAQTNDFKRATVVVTGPGLPVPITRTVALAAP
jgi:type II secretion system protein I